MILQRPMFPASYPPASKFKPKLFPSDFVSQLCTYLFSKAARQSLQQKAWVQGYSLIHHCNDSFECGRLRTRACNNVMNLLNWRMPRGLASHSEHPVKEEYFTMTIQGKRNVFDQCVLSIQLHTFLYKHETRPFSLFRIHCPLGAQVY